MKSIAGKICFGAVLTVLACIPAQANAAYGFLLPGEIVVTQAKADVTGDNVEDDVYLVGTATKPEDFVRNLNVVVEEGATKLISRSVLSQVAGYRGTLEIGDFNGDKIKDVMFMTQAADLRMRAYMIDFHKESPEVIFQSKDNIAPDTHSGDITITKDDDKKLIRVKKGSALQLQLPENPSTGYTWQFTQSTGGECVSFLGQRHFLPDQVQSAAGKPGLTVFYFQTKATGAMEMILANYRTWEGSNSAIDHFSVRVEIVE